MIKVIVAGAAGRMGRRIGYMVDQHPALTYAGAFEAPGSEQIGSDTGELAGIVANGVIISECQPSEIGIQTIRDADMVGDHIVYFSGPGERIELSHRVQTRDHVARAQRWQRPGSKAKLTVSIRSSMCPTCRLSKQRLL